MSDMQGKRILVIDDNRDLLRLITRVFEQTGAETISASDGREGLLTMLTQPPDLVILDLMMPQMDGWTVCRQIRRFSAVPIIVLSVLDRDADVIRGLDCGADYFVTKPFSPNVLLARARAALRRGVPADGDQPFTYRDDHLTVDMSRRRVRVGGEMVSLSGTEFRLLAYLLQNPCRVLTFRQILENVWTNAGLDQVEYVHTYIWRLRQKLEIDPGHPAYLLSEHRVGYSFQMQPC